MGVPASGQLRLRADINQEVNGNDTDTNVSLGTLSDEAGFDTPPDQMSEFYGYTACVAPSVTTNTSTSVGSGSFVANGNLTNLGGAGCNQTDHGFYVGTSTNYSSNTKHSLGARTTTGTFSKQITGLSSNSTYRVFAYSTNAVGETVGGMVTTTTALPGISVYIAGNYSFSAIDNEDGCGTNGGSLGYGECTAPYGACGTCGSGSSQVFGYGIIQGSGCQYSLNYGTTWTNNFYVQTFQGGDSYQGTWRWNMKNAYDRVRCSTCSPSWYRYLARSGYADRSLGSNTLSWTT